MLQTALRQSCMNLSSVFEGPKIFKEDRECVRNNKRCGKSKEVRTPEMIGQIKNFMSKNRRVSIKIISTQFDTSVGTEHTIIREELKMRKTCAKFVPRAFREHKKEIPCHDSREMFELINLRRPDRANPPTNIRWFLFLTALALSRCTGFPLDRQSTGNTMLRF